MSVPIYQKLSHTCLKMYGRIANLFTFPPHTPWVTAINFPAHVCVYGKQAVVRVQSCPSYHLCILNSSHLEPRTPVMLPRGETKWCELLPIRHGVFYPNYMKLGSTNVSAGFLQVLV